jgi:hypothetical protein
MIRDVPSLYDTILKVIARYPTKSLTKASCEKLMKAIENNYFGEDVDILQIILNQVIDAGRMTDDAVPTLVYKNRRELSLSNSKISGKYLVSAANLCSTHLLKLDVSGCFQVADHQILEVLGKFCPNLYKLNVRNCRKLTDEFLVSFINQKYYSNLRELNIGGNFNITDKGVSYFIENNPHMNEFTELMLSGLQISDETILLISKKCKSLIALGLGYCDLKETTIQHLLIKIGSQLEIFDWSWPSTNPVVTNPQPSTFFVIDSLATLCPSLKEIDLTGNRNMSLQSIAELIERKLLSVSLSVFFFSFLFFVLTLCFVG